MSPEKRSFPRPQDLRRRQRMKGLGIALLIGVLFSALLGFGLWLLNRR